MANVVLIVDDDRDWRDRLEDWAAKFGWSSVLTGDPRAGLEAIYALGPTALVLDLRLKTEKEGNFLGWLLAEQAMICSVPIVIVTGYAKQAAGAVSQYEEGVVAFFDKGSVTEQVFHTGLLRAIQATEQRKLPQGQRKLEMIRSVGTYVSGATGTRIPNPNTASVRWLLLNAFSDEEITTFCFDCFRPVYDKFAEGMSFPFKVHLLIEYCDRHGEIAKLLPLVKKHNPAKYAEFEALLGANPNL
jgi:FixJ family two-component response regulator